MKIRVISDLHLEFDDPASVWVTPSVHADLTIIAGDVDSWRRPEVLVPYLVSQNVIMILGNHDFYGVSISTGKEIWQNMQSQINRMALDLGHKGRLIIVSDCSTITFNSTRFICATLWTDLDRSNPLLTMDAMNTIADFEHIVDFTIDEWLSEHSRHISYIRSELSKSYSGKTVVVTHHAPSYSCVNEEHESNSLNGAYASNLNNDLSYGGADLWIHGHMHKTSDDDFGTRVICNSRGYSGHQINSNFDPYFVVEV